MPIERVPPERALVLGSLPPEDVLSTCSRGRKRVTGVEPALAEAGPVRPAPTTPR